MFGDGFTGYSPHVETQKKGEKTTAARRCHPVCYIPIFRLPSITYHPCFFFPFLFFQRWLLLLATRIFSSPTPSALDAVAFQFCLTSHCLHGENDRLPSAGEEYNVLKKRNLLILYSSPMHSQNLQVGSVCILILEMYEWT